MRKKKTSELIAMEDEHAKLIRAGHDGSSFCACRLAESIRQANGELRLGRGDYVPLPSERFEGWDKAPATAHERLVAALIYAAEYNKDHTDKDGDVDVSAAVLHHLSLYESEDPNFCPAVHHGDCNGQPQTCCRCFVEEFEAKARKLIDAMKARP